MKHFMAGLITVATVVTFAAFGSVWVAAGIVDNNPLEGFAGACMFLAAMAGVYVVGEALDT